MAVMGNCRHCGEYRRLHRRRLCSPCYYRPGVRRRYDPKVVPPGSRVGRLPGRPTEAVPGSEAKIQIMIARVARGERPCHPDDARSDTR